MTSPEAARAYRTSGPSGPALPQESREAQEGGDSRIWAGIHYPMDNVAGVALGKSVAQVFLDWAENDGSQ
jgi:hypothetical protein